MRSPFSAFIKCKKRLKPVVTASRRTFHANALNCSTQSGTTVVAVSGGVDSSMVAFRLLQQQQHQNNHHVELLHMTNWNVHDDDSIVCSSHRDWQAAQAVARHLNVALHQVNLEHDYWHAVFEPYLRNIIVHGQLGNPDMDCNVHVKFGALINYLRAHYNDNVRLATGHYARLWRPHDDAEIDHDVASTLTAHPWLVSSSSSLEHQPPQQQTTLPLLLVAGVDARKDQSYFLAGCAATQLQNVDFPLGACHKTDIQQQARWHGLPTAQRRESMGLCFVGKRANVPAFLSHYLPPAEQCVDFCDIATGQILHTTATPTWPGLYAMGQGAKLGGQVDRYFVCGMEAHKVWVCAGTHHPALYAATLTVQVPSWVAGVWPAPLWRHDATCQARCRIRHLQPLVPCTLRRVGHHHQTASLRVELDGPLRGIGLGQWAVFYVDQVCLGGGPISGRGPSYYEQGKAVPTPLHPSSHNDRLNNNTAVAV